VLSLFPCETAERKHYTCTLLGFCRLSTKEGSLSSGSLAFNNDQAHVAYMRAPQVLHPQLLYDYCVLSGAIWFSRLIPGETETASSCDQIESSKPAVSPDERSFGAIPQSGDLHATEEVL
jgi:hypothetical protein